MPKERIRATGVTNAVHWTRITRLFRDGGLENSGQICQTYRRPDWLVLLLLVCAFDIGACCCLYAFAVAYTFAAAFAVACIVASISSLHEP
jgi:hypothetical protein